MKELKLEYPQEGGVVAVEESNNLTTDDYFVNYQHKTNMVLIRKVKAKEDWNNYYNSKGKLILRDKIIAHDGSVPSLKDSTIPTFEFEKLKERPKSIIVKSRTKKIGSTIIGSTPSGEVTRIGDYIEEILITDDNKLNIIEIKN